MKRRGFLGLIGGAAVAGPSVAKNALVTAAPLSGSAYAGMALSLDNLADPPETMGYATTLGSKSNWKIDRIGRIKRLLSGEEEDEEHDIRPRLRMSEHNINALGSVSPVSKVRMFRSAVKSAQREQRKRSWLQELLELETGEDF